MRTVAISWDSSAGRFVARGSHVAHSIHINAPRAEDETRGSTGFSATELLLAGAGACSSWDVVEILRKRRHDITSLDVTVEGEQAAEAPWAYERVTLHFRVSGHDLRAPVLERVVRLSCVRYCSVLATIGGVARVEATLELIDADGVSRGRQPVPLDAVPSTAFAADEADIELPLDDED